MLDRAADDSHRVRLASDGVATPAAASVDRLQPPAAILQASEPRYDAALVLAIAFGAGIGFVLGRRALR
jgi:hypothetical protein